jgi:hypothetical protein
MTNYFVVSEPFFFELPLSMEQEAEIISIFVAEKIWSLELAGWSLCGRAEVSAVLP